MLNPTFGLNFVEDKNLSDKNFMLLCGFEKFERYFVRIDILERLFIHIVKSEDKEIKLVPEMLNLLGCNKENFLKLIKLMNYKPSRNNEIYSSMYRKKILKIKVRIQRIIRLKYLTKLISNNVWF